MGARPRQLAISFLVAYALWTLALPSAETTLLQAGFIQACDHVHFALPIHCCLRSKSCAMERLKHACVLCLQVTYSPKPHTYVDAHEIAKRARLKARQRTDYEAAEADEIDIDNQKEDFEVL